MSSIRECDLTRSCQTKCYANSSSKPCTSIYITKSTAELVNTETTTVPSPNRTALIAGLVTGLVGFTIILVTIFVFVHYKRKKKQRKRLSYDDEKLSSHPPVIISDINTILPPTPSPRIPAILPPINEAQQWQTGTEHLDYDHPHSPFIIGAQSLQIPHLDTPDPSIRRSLNIQPTTTKDYTQLNRASSVKVTKYDHRLIPATTKTNHHKKFEDAILKRAISVKKNNSTNSHSSSITKVGSVHSEDIKLAKPTMVRINTITSKEGGITRKKSFRTVIEQPPYFVTLDDIPPEDNRVNLYFFPEQSQASIQSSNSTSTLGDGEITVYLQPNNDSP